MERGIWLIVALGAGLFIGKNWEKISKVAGPYTKIAEGATVKGYNTVVRILAEQKEHVEDMIASAKVSKVKKPAVVAMVAKKTRKAPVRKMARAKATA